VILAGDSILKTAQESDGSDGSCYYDAVDYGKGLELKKGDGSLC